MRPDQVPPVVLAAAQKASAAEPEQLNSERIAQRFGSYGVEVLAAEAGLRRANLHSIEASLPVCRTYAVVQFSDQDSEQIRHEHARILTGSSIGSIFKANGWQIDKQTLHVGRIHAAATSRLDRLMRLEYPQNLALHVYQMILSKGSLSVDYATIIETHHPAYLAQSDLDQMYPRDGAAPLDTDAVSQLLELVLNTEQ